MNVRDVIQRIECVAPLWGASSWDKSGVQVAGRTSDVRRLALALDPLPEVIRQALDWGAELILTHHPLSLSPRFLDHLDDYHEVAGLLLGRGAWLYAAHTSLDVQPAGPAGWLARDLDLRHLVTLDPVPASVTVPADSSSTLPGPGFGLAGDLPTPLPWAAFVQLLTRSIAGNVWRQVGTPPSTVSRVAYCTGSGGSLLDKAAASGAQVYVTGDVRYHQALEAGVCLVDVGHFALEEEMTRRFASELAHDDHLAAVEVRFLAGTDPFQAVVTGTRG